MLGVRFGSLFVGVFGDLMLGDCRDGSVVEVYLVLGYGRRGYCVCLR